MHTTYLTQHSIFTAQYKYLLLAFYTFSLMEGILRKWIVPGLATPVFFIKYIFSLLILFLLIVNKQKISKQLFPFAGILFFLILYCIMEVFNNNYSKTFLVGCIGLIVYFGFLPLTFSIFIIVREKIHIHKILTAINLISLAIFLLGVVQYFSPPSSIINKYVSEDASIAMVGEYPRIVTIFSFIGTYTSYLNFALVILFVQLLNISGLTLRNLILIATFFLGVINVFMTGSRSAVGLFAIMVTIIFTIHILSLSGSKAISYIVNTFLISIISIFVLANTEAGRASFESFVGRVKSSDNASGRIGAAFEPLAYFDQAGLVGYGIGTTYQGAQALMSPDHTMPPYEEESERIVLELGLIGFIIIILMRFTIFFYAIRTYKKMADPLFKLISLAVVVHQIPCVLVFNVVIFNWLENMVYWSQVGLLVCLNIIDQHEKNQHTGISSN